VDAVCRKLICLSEDAVPTLSAARQRDMLSDEISLITVGCLDSRRSAEDFAVKDFQHVAVRRGHLFTSKGKLVSKVLEKLLDSRPKLKESECVGCAKCANICPAKAIVMENKKAVINRDRCIRCFCCQEFCPTGAMKVKRTLIARILVKSKR
jgi:ferredoxin